MRFEALLNEVEKYSEDSRSFEALIEDVREILRIENASIGGRYRKLSRCPNGLVVVGDIHGDYDTLISFVKRLDLLSFLDNDGCLLFLGDYVDRGEQQIEVLSAVLIIKAYWRNNVVILRGNHEPPRNLIPSPHDFPVELRRRFGFKGLELYNKALELFDELPLIAIVNDNVLGVHGGPPVSVVQHVNSLSEMLNKIEEAEALEDILWSDPIEDDGCWYPSYRGAGKLWGRCITDILQKRLGIEMILRGHEPCHSGFKFNHDRRVLTIFSMLGFYGNEYAAALRVDDLKNLKPNLVEKYIIQIPSTRGA